ncbi:MAG TPA: asparagine synthase (glutamine-hydrolyzing) [Gaiellaceae bacterium]
MCGLVGMVAARGAPAPTPERVERATAALAHRGPDGSGHWSSEAAAFGHTRLSIIDLERGDQPLWNEDRSVLTFYNGEIWNHNELRAELERAGHRFFSRCDTEVLVHGYEEWGLELPERLSGMFAFAIWDLPAERLLLARDRVGKKPLYLAETPQGVAFGSDARSVLLVSGLQPALEPEGVPEYLFQRYLDAPRTLFRGVTKLRPGHLLSYDRERLEQHPYWQLRPGEPEPLQPEELRGLLRDSVRQRLMSDVPLGVLLSGGIDSTAVAGLMRENGAAGIASFTIGFADELYDERPLARLVAARLGTDHHELVVGARQFVDTLPRLSWYRDEPIAEPSELPLLLLAEFASKHVKVVLSGDGGDELFGGYPKYRAERLLRAGGPLAALALKLSAKTRSRRPSHKRLERAAETLSLGEPLLRWASWFRTFSSAELQRLLAPKLRVEARPERLTRPLRELLAPYAGLDEGRRMLVGDFLTYLPDNMLLRGDKVLMAASLEGRMPLLDYRLIERVAKVPASERTGLRQGKAILRRAVEDLLPREIARAPKRGFPVPVPALLLAAGDRSLERLVLSERALSRDLYERRELEALVEGRGSYRVDRDFKLFTVAALELFLRSNIDELTVTPPSPEQARDVERGRAASMP